MQDKEKDLVLGLQHTEVTPTMDGKTNVLASNNSNFVKPAPGEALLVSWDDATTFFP
jgi:Zn-dependent oligopeptidase